MANLTSPSAALHGGQATFVDEATKFDDCRRILFKSLIQKGHRASLAPALQKKVLAGMRSENQEIGAVAIPKNHHLPAGFTYLGQLIAHDISYNQMISAGQKPYLRLQSVYGAGPLLMPYLYAHYNEHFLEEGTASPNLGTTEDYKNFQDVKFRLERRGKKHFDVPRMADSLACMADARNDQNFILSQLHCTCLRFHNAMAEYIWANKDKFLKEGEPLFQRTRQEVVMTYQWLVVERYLHALAYPGLVDELKDEDNFILYNARSRPHLMPEFRQAAFRIGHSQVLDAYILNETRERRRIFVPDDPVLDGIKKPNDLRGFRENNNLYIDWTVFFNIDPDVKPQPSAAIDHNISAPLFDLFFLKPGQRSLPALNLERSENLPFGLDLANVMLAIIRDRDAEKAKRADLQLLDDEEVQKAMGIPELTAAQLPLWLYILLEAEIKQGGKRLGLVGSHIVAEQLMWVLHRDSSSYLSNKKWPPVLNFNDDGQLVREFQAPEDRRIDIQHFLNFLDAAHIDIRKRHLGR